MSDNELQAVVVGAGVAGLAAARELKRFGVELAVLDAGDRPGGVMRSDELRGFRFERGPNSLRVHAAARDFLERHALADALLPAGAEARLRHLYLDGRLLELPLGLRSALSTPLLSARGKLRALGEAFVGRGDAAGESVAEFIERRFGRELLERAVAPFLVGVYGGDERRLGAEAVFPSLVAFERAKGSVLRGALGSALGSRGQARGLPGSWSFQGGLGALAERLAGGLGESLRLGTRVASLAREPAAAGRPPGWRLELEDGAALHARTLLLATDAPAAAALLAGVDREAAALLAAIEYAPLVSAALDVDPGDARHPIEGFGFLVPREAGMDLLGALFMSRVFPGRAPEGRELVMAMIGGARWPGAVDADDDELLARIGAGLGQSLGLRGAPAPLAITRWQRAVAQPAPDHPTRVRALRERAAKLGALCLAGAYLDGVAVADALVSGVRAAAELEPAASS